MKISLILCSKIKTIRGCIAEGSQKHSIYYLSILQLKKLKFTIANVAFFVG